MTIAPPTGDWNVDTGGSGTTAGSRATSSYAREVDDHLGSFAPTPRELEPAAERLDRWADKLAGTPVVDLLDALSESGLKWTDIARLIGVSVTGLNNWRQGGVASERRNTALRRPLAF